jgi:hypothetical protein
MFSSSNITCFENQMDDIHTHPKRASFVKRVVIAMDTGPTIAMPKCLVHINIIHVWI